ncbi:hybrid sensor histidine kinase/response regulator [Jannaschia rubra]|uniref:histidine kinase n=1 Tax=Jannaschia rubra TaxID=282197 RepID=A0A0M6XKV8_9RHOB|nr:ATP-binding protein [Jannaschia rubra]CTQ31820.1 Autoinducer 2 sensor kinase/phosphatase LuxQ [Jannaschia rubra]SFG53072.1 Response regulator receiver domain-containing protein [Jannaschia rubra]
MTDDGGGTLRTDAPAPDGMQLLGHDIRSAVSDVIGGLRLMDRDTLPPDSRAQFDRVHAASELLARLVEELLDGTPRDTAGPVGNLNLRRFLDDELRRWHGAAQGTGTGVTLDRAADLPEIVQLNLLHLRRIVANLMGNALRHAEGGRVTLGAELAGDGALSIRVTDNGRGFPPDLLPDLFKPAIRGDDGIPGTGMGLHIASAHAEAIGGTLDARNGPHGGAQVTLTIPRDVWLRPEEPEGGLPDLGGARILVADDSRANLLLVRAMLTRLGAECETARDGIEALNWLARERFDLALIDIEMPSLGGIEVLRSERLRQARGIAPPTSMVAMTAYVLRDNRDVIFDAGADGILAKPLGSIEDFGKAIRHYLDLAPDAAAWTPDTAPALSAVTLAELMRAAGPEFEGQLLDRLREDLEMVARNLKDAVADADLAAILSQTHILLSLSSAVGALPTQEAARRLNHAASREDPEALRAASRLCLSRLAQLRSDLDAAH